MLWRVRLSGNPGACGREACLRRHATPSPGHRGRPAPDLPKALLRFSDDQAVRILTIHKSKGTGIRFGHILAVDNEIFLGDQDANRCAFFVGVSRAKRRLALTFAGTRARPLAYNGRWDIQRTAEEEYFSYSTPHLNA